jgi:chromate reductase, NAD(P)H dehydrogenase (quinone)
MHQYEIAVIVGSLRRESLNRKLANAIIKLAPSDFTFKHVSIGALPLYNQDDDADPPESVKQFKRSVLASQGLLFFTPEYNRSIPGVLKNAIDHGSRPYGKSAWAHKPAGVLGAAPSPLGTAVAQHDLRSVLGYLDVRTMGQPEAYVQVKDGLFDDAGNIGTNYLKFMQAWMDSYVSWVKSHTI